MQGIPEMGNTSTEFASSIYGGSYVRVSEEDDNITTPNSYVNFEEHPIQNEEQPKKQKKRKVDGNRQDLDKIINALEKREKRIENREFWMEMDNDEERLAWIESLQN
ncbi:hypothetical protein EZV62_005036 [Acer yangbiense]|uniref:Uncharacterized protein n=1 Tax=Acer yangbiense TaxID=1000413 RepID=A0A5C7ILL6_9ROSI|nr:hypothetical protein EZV62_005036 [Acer yangbiense]